MFYPQLIFLSTGTNAFIVFLFYILKKKPQKDTIKIWGLKMWEVVAGRSLEYRRLEDDEVPSCSKETNIFS